MLSYCMDYRSDYKEKNRARPERSGETPANCSATRSTHRPFPGIKNKVLPVSTASEGYILSRLMDDPDTKIDYLIDNLLRFFTNKNMITIYQCNNRVRGLFYPLDQIRIQVKFRMVDPGQLDHAVYKNIQ